MSGWSFPGNLGNKEVVRTFSICTLYLAGHVFVGGLLQSTMRPVAGHPPEDDILPLPFPAEDSGDNWDTGKRLARAIGNTTEHVPFDLVVAWLGVFLGNDKNSDLQKKLMIGYTACRVGHTVCYLGKLQPFRTLFWAASKVCVGVIAVKGLQNLK